MNIKKIVLSAALALSATGTLPATSGEAMWPSTAPVRCTLNFLDLDIAPLIDAVSSCLDRSVSVEAGARGPITLISAKALTRAEVYQALVRVVIQAGFEVAEQGETTKILPRKPPQPSTSP